MKHIRITLFDKDEAVLNFNLPYSEEFWEELLDRFRKGYSPRDMAEDIKSGRLYGAMQSGRDGLD